LAPKTAMALALGPIRKAIFLSSAKDGLRQIGPRAISPEPNELSLERNLQFYNTLHSINTQNTLTDHAEIAKYPRHITPLQIFSRTLAKRNAARRVAAQ
jgi:hypothetical protein